MFGFVEVGGDSGVDEVGADGLAGFHGIDGAEEDEVVGEEAGEDFGAFDGAEAEADVGLLDVVVADDVDGIGLDGLAGDDLGAVLAIDDKGELAGHAGGVGGVFLDHFDVNFEGTAFGVGLGVDAMDAALEDMVAEGVEGHVDELAEVDLGFVFFIDGGAHDEVFGADVGDLHDVVVDGEACADGDGAIEDLGVVDGAANGLAIDVPLGDAEGGFGDVEVFLEFEFFGGVLGFEAGQLGGEGLDAIEGAVEVGLAGGVASGGIGEAFLFAAGDVEQFDGAGDARRSSMARTLSGRRSGRGEV